jgi:hypothetical protein
MAGYPVVNPPSRPDASPTPRRVSLAFLLAAAAIIGVGVMLFTEFMLTFELVYLSSVLLFLVGGLMLFHPLSGPDRSG